MRAVGIQESTADIYDHLVSPVHDQALFFHNLSDNNRLQVFFLYIFHHFLKVVRVQHNCHTLLGLGNSKLRAVQTGIFLRNHIQIDAKAVRQFADSYGYTAGAEVVTLLDQAADFRATEQTLNLALGRCITLLNLCATGLDGGCGVRLRGTGCATAAVTTSASANQKESDRRDRRSDA